MIIVSRGGRDVSVRKIAITIPDALLERLDRRAARRNQSRSRFIAEQLAKRLQELEDEEVTRLYDEAYQDEHALRENQQLAEDMGHLRPRDDGDEAW
jgi:metal-responsive CopG/Arc/MetJ family transcriptional regulator